MRTFTPHHITSASSSFNFNLKSPAMIEVRAPVEYQLRHAALAPTSLSGRAATASAVADACASRRVSWPLLALRRCECACLQCLHHVTVGTEHPAPLESGRCYPGSGASGFTRSRPLACMTAPLQAATAAVCVWRRSRRRWRLHSALPLPARRRCLGLRIGLFVARRCRLRLSAQPPPLAPCRCAGGQTLSLHKMQRRVSTAQPATACLAMHKLV
jgi:hypothetical protein